MFEAKKVPGFDFDLFRVKPEVGRRMPPKADMYSNIAIFGDNVTARLTQTGFQPIRPWSSMENQRQLTTYAGKSSATTQPEHRAEQLDYMEDVARKSQGVWLNSIHFAEHGHCTCPRCKELHAKSGLSWYEWRRKEVTDYMAASKRPRNQQSKETILHRCPTRPRYQL